MYGVIEAEIFRPNYSNNDLKYMAAGIIFGVGDRPDVYKRPWVARISGKDEKWGYRREFVRGAYDYTRTNNVASRGTYLYYAVPPGIYEVCRDVTWRRHERFFCRVDDAGDVTEITREEVDAWLNQTSDT